MWNINAHQGRIPCAIFTIFAEFVPRFRMRLFRWICSRGYGVMGVLIWRGLVTRKFSVPLAAKLCIRPTNFLEVQERARGPLSPCHVWWGSEFIRRRGGEKRWVFVCPSRFWTSEFVRPISPWRCWSRDTILMSLDRGRFVVPVLNFLRLLPNVDITKCRRPKNGKNLGFSPPEAT